jgi:hypothetical protein
MGERGRDWVLGHFNAPAVAAQTLQLYEEITGRAKTPALATRLRQNERILNTLTAIPTVSIVAIDETTLTYSPFLPIFRQPRRSSAPRPVTTA